MDDFLQKLKRWPVSCFIMCHLISMRAGPAALQFGWSRAGLSMDLPVFVYSHTKTGLKFLLGQGRCLGQLSIWFTGYQLHTTKIEPYGFLFCLDLSLSRSVDHQGLLSAH